MNKTILVTGIGGNVGYGILKNIREAFPGMKLIGTNTQFLSPGNHLCDEVYEVPFSTSDAYIPALRNICNQQEVALIVPGTDYETYALSSNQAQLPTVAVSPADTCKIFLDKYESYLAFQSIGLPFAQSILPSSYTGEFGACIVKPREGRGSRNIFINPSDPSSYDDEYIVQPLLKGPEITTAFYVTRAGALHGQITLARQLSNGATSSCEVTDEYDAQLHDILAKLIRHIPIGGSCNLQSIVTPEGIVPFEVNCRISGTNSIRSHFGFEDVKYTVQEWLLGEAPSKSHITKGSAIRILSDIIYPGISLSGIRNSNDTFHIS